MGEFNIMQDREGRQWIHTQESSYGLPIRPNNTLKRVSILVFPPFWQTQKEAMSFGIDGETWPPWYISKERLLKPPCIKHPSVNPRISLQVHHQSTQKFIHQHSIPLQISLKWNYLKFQSVRVVQNHCAEVNLKVRNGIWKFFKSLYHCDLMLSYDRKVWKKWCSVRDTS